MIHRRTALLSATSTLATLATRARAQMPDFHIGVVASVTGPFAAATKDTFDGLNAWMKVRGLPNRKVVLETLDDETNPVNAANLFRRLAGQPEIALIYLFINSTSAMAAKSFASEYKVPIISGGGADALGHPADPWFFKVAPSNRDYMIAMSKYLKAKGYTKLGLFYGTDTFGQYDRSNLHDLAPQYGYTIVDEESFSPDDTNFNAQWTRLRAANPDVLYSSASGRAAALSFRAYKQLGIKTPLIETGSGVSEAFFKALGGADKADGLMAMTQLGSLGGRAGGDSDRFFAELKQGMDGRTPVFFNAFGFDVGLITEAALKNSDGSRQGIRDAIEKLKDLPGLNGPISYSPEEHTGQDSRSIAVGRLEGGSFVPAT
ncbi:MAG: ABC transporter substrate-binding protein [Acetobacteraceae bacterium]|nr:ABC transporter substrate-binding protein [Acetobacteraceae bacterium]